MREEGTLYRGILVVTLVLECRMAGLAVVASSRPSTITDIRSCSRSPERNALSCRSR